MPATSEIILSATTSTYQQDSTSTVVGEKYKGDGYYGRSDGLHTVQMNVSGFIGNIKMQGTLATEPTDADWFNIVGAELDANDSSLNGSDGAFLYNFTGNFVWVRAYVTNFFDGTINSILLNH